jgi:hypothetical protein
VNVWLKPLMTNFATIDDELAREVAATPRDDSAGIKLFQSSRALSLLADSMERSDAETGPTVIDISHVSRISWLDAK